MEASSRRQLLGLAGRGLALTALAPLGACGFSPLYAENKQGETVSDKLATVRVEPLRDRVGQQMHNLLRDRFNPKGQPAAADYSLVMSVTETIRELAVRQDETATRANLTLDANFGLRRTNDGEEVLNGRSTSTTSYDILREPFASTISERDARDRALREVADDVQARVAIFFRTS